MGFDLILIAQDDYCLEDWKYSGLEIASMSICGIHVHEMQDI